MNKILILLSLIIFVNLKLASQNSDLDQHRFFDDVHFGGGVNIGMGNTYSTFSISPSVIYSFSDKFSAGVNLTYAYVKTKSISNSISNHFGGSILALYEPINHLRFAVEYEQLKIDQTYIYLDNAPIWQPAFYIGAEYVIGRFSMGLRYDLMFEKNKNIIYSAALTPVFRVYF